MVVQLGFESGVDCVEVLLYRVALGLDEGCEGGAMVLIGILEPVGLFYVSVEVLGILLFGEE